MTAIVARHVQIAMRDGTKLSADIYRPEESGSFPTVLVRTCYTKLGHASPRQSGFWTGNGYAYVVQDVRGRGDSEGTFYPLIFEKDDGSDTIDWIAAQSWSDGRVVMSGGSYLGWTQLYAACSDNRHLITVIPVATPGDPDRGFPMSYGMIMPAAASWMATLDGHLNQDLNAGEVARAYGQRPIIDFDRVIGRRLRPWREWIGHAVRDVYWDKQSYQRQLIHSRQRMMHVSGWYDDCLKGSLENFCFLSGRAQDCDGQPVQRLMVGPWLHGSIGQRKIGAVDYGEAAALDLNQLQLEWFETCLKEQPTTLPPVQLFVMGRNAWIHEQEWPVARTICVPYYLHSGGRANSRNGDGHLSTLPPSEETQDHFTYDPDNPVPYSPDTDWRQVGGPDDCATLELRDDILVYTTDAFEVPILICGPLRVTLYAASSARDTDFTAKILDVYPDGKAIRLNDGAIRARFRKGHDRELFLLAGEVEEYDIDCWATCIELEAGHRLRLEVSSSAFGKYDVNFNGGGPIGVETEPITALQTIYHDAGHPSCVLLPILR